MPLLFLFFILLPVIEITLLIKVGQAVGILYTLGLLVLMGVAGVLMLRWQGFSTLLKVNQRLQEGTLPAREIVSGAVLALGGFLLVLPGFFTDILAFFCLLPPTRFLLVEYILRKGLLAGEAGPGMMFFRYSGRPAQDDIIEGEFCRDNQRRLDKE